MRLCNSFKDSINYTHLLFRLAPEKCNNLALQERDVQNRANLVVQNARALGVDKFLTPDYIITVSCYGDCFQRAGKSKNESTFYCQSIS